jgi:hypothetical protein
MVPIMLAERYKANGWLGMLLGTRLWYMFLLSQDDTTFGAKISELCRELGPPEKGGNAAATPAPTPTPAAVPAPTPAPAPAPATVPTAAPAVVAAPPSVIPPCNLGELIAPLSERVCRLADAGLLSAEAEAEILDNVTDWLEWGSAKKLGELAELSTALPVDRAFARQVARKAKR